MIREPRGSQSSFGGTEYLGDEVSAYPSLKGGQELEFYSYKTYTDRGTWWRSQLSIQLLASAQIIISGS